MMVGSHYALHLGAIRSLKAWRFSSDFEAHRRRLPPAFRLERPLACLDKASRQLIEETRLPIPV